MHACIPARWQGGVLSPGTLCRQGKLQHWTDKDTSPLISLSGEPAKPFPLGDESPAMRRFGAFIVPEARRGFVENKEEPLCSVPN